ncbi:fasciculation and elongation protein zeta-1 isoform X2 [Anarrhichthys ocellatus]|uniref:fasciculation and elongation protein zeta-1 isoform X2 n=1 Tax=Anarrhichthys ocellatus TaxID=433405 RepID=UPI0012EECBD5|nr:fasciculation and elongation protein zeta-1 isoform X2 [Anarrhichthys ocellatus]
MVSSVCPGVGSVTGSRAAGLSQPLSGGGKKPQRRLLSQFYVIRPRTDACSGLQSESTGTMIVWDALTDNYISTWDGTDSEGLNGNLSEQEIHEKEEEEMNEKNDNANCLKEEPLITADQVIEEIVEMMENSPDPGETEEEDEEESSHCSSRTNPSLLEEIRQLSQASNNNCSYEGQR